MSDNDTRSIRTVMTIAWGWMVTAKLTGVIDWPWLLVFVPFWVPIVEAVGVLLVLGVGIVTKRLAATVTDWISSKSKDD